MAKLILIRHGQSLWNALNVFTGWVDIPLSEKGIEEALDAGKLLENETIDIVFVSTLCRALMTGMLVMAKNKKSKAPRIIGKDSDLCNLDIKEMTTPVIQSAAINERMYGKLQGRNKDEVKKEFGEEQFKIWRRGYDTPPPEGESLKMTAERALPYFNKEITDQLKAGKNVLVSAHGNSLRAIIMHLDKLSEDEVCKLEVPTGKPITYTFKDGTFTKSAT